MPSKYSHSVVLAQQSSRGLIHLPNDQYIDYLRSSPLLTTKAPPKKRTRATSTKTNGSDRLAVQHSLGQQSSSDQLSAKAFQNYSSGGRLHGTPRRVIIDSDDEISQNDSERYSESSIPSNAPISARSASPVSKQTRMPLGLPIEVHQQAVQTGIFSSVSSTSRRDGQRTPTRPKTALIPKLGGRDSVELSTQKPAFSEPDPRFTRSVITTGLTHNRDISVPMSPTTPPLSPTGTKTTHQDESPATPLSGLQRRYTPTMAEGSKSLIRDSSSLSRDARIYRPTATKMPLQANFDTFVDNDVEGATDLPESPAAHQSRLTNMRSYHAIEKVVHDLPREGAYGTSKNVAVARAVELSEDLRAPPSAYRYRGRVDSLDSLSSLSLFGKPSVSQTTGRPKTSAAAMSEAPITSREAWEAESAPAPPSTIRRVAVVSKKHNQASASAPASTAKTQSTAAAPSPFVALSNFAPQSQLTVAESLFSLPKIPHSPLLRNFDPSLLKSIASSSSANPTLAQFLADLDGGVNDEDEEGENEQGAAMPPPDVQRRPRTGMSGWVEPGSQLIVDGKGGVSMVGAQGTGHQRARSRSFGKLVERKDEILRSLRLKGRKR